MNNIIEGINLFNNKDFFAAHDFFEELWIEADYKDRLFYQGMVQVSVGSFHLISGNYKGALSQFNKGTSKLENYVTSYKGVNVSKLIFDIYPLINDLEKFFTKNENNILLEKLPEIEYFNKM